MASSSDGSAIPLSRKSRPAGQHLSALVALTFATTVWGTTIGFDAAQLHSTADLVVTAELLSSADLRDSSGMTCGVRYVARVLKFEKGTSDTSVVVFAMGPDYKRGERFRLYLRHLESERAIRQGVPNSSKRAKTPPGVASLFRCPGVIPGWIPIAIDRIQ